MRFVLQCVSQTSCMVKGRVTDTIERGYLILTGILGSGTKGIAGRMLKEVAGFRIFPNENGKTSLSLAEIGGDIPLISRFALYADCRKGNRPSSVKTGEPEHTERLYRYPLEHYRRGDIGKMVEEGIFGMDMKIVLVNEGPFTLVLDLEELLHK